MDAIQDIDTTRREVKQRVKLDCNRPMSVPVSEPVGLLGKT